MQIEADEERMCLALSLFHDFNIDRTFISNKEMNLSIRVFISFSSANLICVMWTNQIDSTQTLRPCYC
jgi:hypothetical protein